ncbi:TetR/AcrR family transcriptional regulator [bacterium D16-54]|nr:TetR/AcrR family transcriptional regulator [bacterium D16-54]RKJ14467.1 TetR/AcrR family transcriptional regulator [bacterium D16-56]
MAKQIEGVSERILDCAKAEFLEKGFTDASLRTIAANADTTTGSIYTRFGDKEGLFRAIVEPAADGMMQILLENQKAFHALAQETQRREMEAYSFRGMDVVLDYMYGHFELFRLLLDASHGTKFQHFLDELVRIEVEYTYKYMEAVGCKTGKSGMVTEEFLHIVTTSFFNGVFEVVRHQMDKESAKGYIKMLQRYHMAGFDTIYSWEKNG